MSSDLPRQEITLQVLIYLLSFLAFMGVARRKVSLMDTGKTFGKGLSQQLNIIVKDY